MGGWFSWAPVLIWVPDCSPRPRSGGATEVGALQGADHQALGGRLGRDDLRLGMEVFPSETSEPEWESSRFRRSPVKGARSRGPNRSTR